MAVSVFARVGCNDQHEFGIAKLFGALYIFRVHMFLCIGISRMYEYVYI